MILAPLILLSAINIWPGVAPGSEKWTQKEKTLTDTPIGTVVINVVTPTLTPYLPEHPSGRTPAVIVAPGGAFVALAMDLEGTSVAEWLRQKGIAAFVLKYRTIEKKTEGIPKLDQDEAAKYGIADAIRAIRIVREHASEWNVDARRVGIIGFSAGAMIAAETLVQQDAAARPDFAAMMYGAPFGRMPAIPPHLPPAFVAWAQDDMIARSAAPRFCAALTAAGNNPEIHIFSAGGHGFGTRKQGTTSDYWIDEFYDWLVANHLR